MYQRFIRSQDEHFGSPCSPRALSHPNLCPQPTHRYILNQTLLFPRLTIFVFQRIAIAIRMDARPKDVMLMDNVIANVRSRALIVLNALIFTMDFQTVKKTVSLIFIKNY